MADASSMVGMKGISMVSTLDVRWVNTIVLIRPILLAIHLHTKRVAFSPMINYDYMLDPLGAT